MPIREDALKKIYTKRLSINISPLFYSTVGIKWSKYIGTISDISVSEKLLNIAVSLSLT